MRRVPVVAALVGAVVVASLVFVALPAERTPLRLIRLFAGEPVERIDVEGGAVVDLRVASEDPRTVRAVAEGLRVRARRGGLEAHAIVEGSRVHFGLLRHDPAQAMERAEGLLVTGTFALKLVDNDARFMRELAAALGDRGVAVDEDVWWHDASGSELSDVFVTAATEQELRAILARVTPEPGRELAIERLPRGGARSYYLHADAVLDHTSIANAEVVWAEHARRAEVLVTFTDAGARRFGEVTGDNVGRKIAIVVNGRVVSAPVIQAPVTAGRTAITMGGNDPDGGAAEATELAATLGAAPLPASVAIAGVAANPARVSSGTLQLARLALAVLAGLAVFGAGFAVDRAVAARTPTCVVDGADAARSLPWLRLLVTVAAPLGVVLAGSRWLLPGIDQVELGNLLGGTESASARAQLGVLALGLSPVLAAFVIVELVALAVPRWRPLRESGGGRLRLGLAAIVLGVALATLQGWMLATWIQSIGAGGAFVGPSLVEHDAVAFRPVAALTLAGGTTCLVVLAWAVSRCGLANGFSVLIAAGIAVDVVDVARYLRASAPSPIELLVAVGAATAVVLATVWALRARARGARLPSGGLVPIGWGTGVVQLVTWLAWLGMVVPMGWMDVLAPTSATGVAIYAALLVGFGAVCSFLFSRVGPLHPANLVSTGYLLAIGAAHVALLRWSPGAALDVLGLAILAAIVVDVVDEWRARARHGELARVRDLHRVQEVDRVLAVLHDAGIPAHARGAGHRALLHLFGPFVPISIHVPADRVDEAARLLR